MVRCIQAVGVLRHHNEGTLRTTMRIDVRGREQELLEESSYRRYRAFLDKERKLFGQLMRMDELLAVFSDDDYAIISSCGY